MTDETRPDREADVTALRMLWAHAVDGCLNDAQAREVDHARDRVMAALLPAPHPEDAETLRLRALDAEQRVNLIKHGAYRREQAITAERDAALAGAETLRAQIEALAVEYERQALVQHGTDYALRQATVGRRLRALLAAAPAPEPATPAIYVDAPGVPTGRDPIPAPTDEYVIDMDTTTGEWSVQPDPTPTDREALDTTEPTQMCECPDVASDPRFHGGNADRCIRAAADHGDVIASPALCLPCLHGCELVPEPSGEEPVPASVGEIARLRCYSCHTVFTGIRGRLDTVCPSCGSNSYTTAPSDTTTEG